ncbi:hypothetical protein BC834DRAFT_999184 [Gloeopeniophorella convolvens]|nr:hypothetical protein BC834DRAFT_999184 [Gloeopeniophorella convolvens]
MQSSTISGLPSIPAGRSTTRTSPLPEALQTPGTSASGSNAKIECIICGDSLPIRSRSYRAPCGHDYCRTCLVDLVTAAASDETLLPVRCCQKPLPEGTFIELLAPAAQDRYHTAAAEFSVPHKECVYCQRTSCAAFVGRADKTRSSIACSVAASPSVPPAAPSPMQASHALSMPTPTSRQSTHSLASRAGRCAPAAARLSSCTTGATT